MVLRDPFGLTNRFAEVGATGDIVVLPRIDPLVGGRPPGNGVGAEGEIPFMVALHGEDDQSIREYRDGDDLRRIHWPATARTGDLMVRQEDRPARRRAMILLDPRAGAHQGHGASSSFEWAVSAAASVVTHLAGLGYATHLICSETVHDGQAAMTTDADHALDLLAEAETGPETELAELVRAAHPVTASGGLVVAVLADRDEESLRQVASLRQPGGSGLAIVLYPMLAKTPERTVDGKIPPRTFPTVAFGFVLGVLVTLTSVGSGAIGVSVLAALYPLLPAKRIVGSDVAHAVPLTLVGGLGHLSLGNVDPMLLVGLLCGSIPGILIGARLAGLAPEWLLRPMLAIMLCYAAYLLYGKI